MAKLSYEDLLIKEKYCNCCKQVKPVRDFYLCDTNRMKDGLQNFCKDCTKLKRRLKESGVVDIELAIADFYDLKFCTGCESYLPKSCFWKGGESDNLQHYCKHCYSKFISRGGNGLRDDSKRVHKPSIDTNVSFIGSTKLNRYSRKYLDSIVEPVVTFKKLLESCSLKSEDFFRLFDYYNSCSDDSKDVARKVL